MAHWLTWKCAMGAVAAREHIRVGAALADLHHGAYTITPGPAMGLHPGPTAGRYQQRSARNRRRPAPLRRTARRRSPTDTP